MRGANGLRRRLEEMRRAPDGLPRPGAPFARGPVAARILASVIDASAWAGARLPPGIAHGAAVAGGACEWAVRPAKRRRLAANLAHAVGRPPGSREVRRLVRREFVNEAHRSADLLWALGRPGEFLETVVVEGAEHARRAAAGGGGLILAGIHIGGWEVATAVPRAVLGVPTTVIVADDWLAWAIDHMRTTAGLRVMYRTEPAIRAVRLLRRGEALLVLGEDGAGGEPRGLEVRFLDGHALLPGGIVALARISGAPIVPFHVLPSAARRWRVIVEPAVEAPQRAEGAEGERRALQVLADGWSEMIRAHPDQWAASHPIRWIAPGATA